MEKLKKTIHIKGKRYEIHLEEKRLVNINNPKDKLEISEEELEYFRQILGRE
ncbi:MAG: hypothetical protein MUF61_03095 [archaeon]|jgi:hypothetical protein|nr:hypothetical protein [archaeon]